MSARVHIADPHPPRRVSDPLALAIAATIAGLAVAISLAWNAELVAALGLTGAALAPALQVL